MSTATTVDPAQHGLTKHSHGAVPVQSRAERFASTNHADFGPVTGREAEWKLTPVALLGALIDGPLDGSAYQVSTVQQPGVTVEWMSRDDARIGRAGRSEERAAANAWSSFEKALTVTIDAESTEPVTVTRTALGTVPRAAHTVITATPNSAGLVILQSTGTAQLTENVEIVVEDGARLTVVSVQEWDDDALHLASHFARVGRGG